MKQKDDKFSPQLIEKGRQLGYTPEGLPLLFLAPMVRVAWAEGFMQGGEQKAILRLAAQLNLTGQRAYERLLQWFDERPEDEFFDNSLADLRELLDALPTQQAILWRDLLGHGCLEVAHAVGDAGFRRGGSNIHPDERASLLHINARLGLPLSHI